MPIYEFKCKNCGKTFEYLCLRSDDEEHATCPSCGKEKAEKMMSTFSSGTSNSGGGLGSLAGASSCSSSGGFS